MSVMLAARRRRVPLLMFEVVLTPKISTVPVTIVGAVRVTTLPIVEPVKVLLNGESGTPVVNPMTGS